VYADVYTAPAITYVHSTARQRQTDVTSGNNLRLRLIVLGQQTSDALLELAVLGGVDERVDTGN